MMAACACMDDVRANALREMGCDVSMVQVGGVLTPPHHHQGALMILAAIVGLGRWGRALVHSVQGGGKSATHSEDIRFVLAHTRTRATAQEFCRDHDLALVASYGRV